jgi:hypothetical protein
VGTSEVGTAGEEKAGSRAREEDDEEEEKGREAQGGTHTVNSTFLTPTTVPSGTAWVDGWRCVRVSVRGQRSHPERPARGQRDGMAVGGRRGSAWTYFDDHGQPAAVVLEDVFPASTCRTGMVRAACSRAGPGSGARGGSESESERERAKEDEHMRASGHTEFVSWHSRSAVTNVSGDQALLLLPK